MSIVRRFMRKLDYLAGKTYMHGTMGTDPEVIKKEGLRTTRNTGRTDTATSLHSYGEHPDNVFMTTKKKTAAQYSGGDVGHVVKVRFPRSVHRALVKSGKLKRDSIETAVPELNHQQSWMHHGDVSPEYIQSIGKMKSFKRFVTEADLLNITKKYPGGHVGHFNVDKNGVMTQKLVPAHKKYTDVYFGDRHDPKEVPAQVGVSWIYHVNKRLVPRAVKMSNVSGRKLSLHGETPALRRIYTKRLPKTFDVEKHRGYMSYNPNKGLRRLKLSLSGLKDTASWLARSGKEKIMNTDMVQDFLEKRKAKRAEGMKGIKEAWIHIKKPLSGGHTGHFIVRDDGHVSQRIVPKGREFNDVDDGSTFHSSEVSPHTSAAWLLHVRRRLLPDAMSAADKSGKTLIAAPGSERQGDTYDAGIIPKEFERGRSVAGFRTFIYRGKK